MLLETILDKIVLFVLFLSIVNTIKESTLFIGAWVKGTKFETTSLRQWLLAASIAFICTVIFS